MEKKSFDDKPETDNYYKAISADTESLCRMQVCGILYEAMNEITAHADSDPRKFRGFERRWKSHSILATNSELHKLE